jgi:hypothetical protein
VRWTWRRPAKAESSDGADRADEAKRARHAAERNLQDAKAQWGAVRSVTETLRRLRVENHFAEKVAETMRRRGDV